MPSLYKNAVIDSDKGRTIPVQALTSPLVLLDAQGQAVESYLAERLRAAREEDARKLEQALVARKKELEHLVEAEARRIYQDAEQSGFDAGLGKAQGEAERLMSEVRQVYQQLEADRQAFVESCRQDITALILGITEQVLRQELTSAAALPSLVATAISELVVRRQVCVFVHPSRVAEVGDAFTQWPLPLDGQSMLVRGDPTLDTTSFRAEDDLGAVLVDLPLLMAKLKLALV